MLGVILGDVHLTGLHRCVVTYNHSCGNIQPTFTALKPLGLILSP